MGVYINMEMPTSCDDCRLNNGISCYAVPEFTEDDVIGRTDDRPDWCPLRPVPPHGRLIDADALRESFRESIEECHKWADEVDKDTMMYARISQSLGTFVECSLRTKAAPTIIESEEST